MRRTRKTLMIVGGLLVAAAGSGYVMLLRDDHRAIAEAGIGDAAAPAAAVPAANGDHTAQGTIAPPAAVAVPSTHVDDAVPQRAAVPPPAAAPARANAAPPSTAVVPVIAGQAPPAKPTAPPPTVHVVTVEPEDSTPAKAKPAPATPQAPIQAAQPPQAARPAQPVQSVQSAPPVQAAQASRPSQQAQPAQRAERKRDGLERHAAAPSGTKSETPETAALVHESAKLDPSLPPPQYVATPSVDRARPPAGGNAVAAAMTEQLVRQSSSFKAPASASAAPAAAQ
ncbi:extensin [Burkholderia ambifaria]|uniref:extensin n=1 Tax=Burkholderia ambifaria TaxID=152480 RepID=UPI00158D20C4|nr:extensin [Burkholderia ambifaria]QQK00763.1 extensin [Burkholderia ambifaria]